MRDAWIEPTEIDRERGVAIRKDDGYCIGRDGTCGTEMTVVTGTSSPIDPSPTYTFTCPSCGEVGYIE
jgi:predicted RNA-binding Zn-ribbon protein involved in translation (DUF1610 family)